MPNSEDNEQNNNKQQPRAAGDHLAELRRRLLETIIKNESNRRLSLRYR